MAARAPKTPIPEARVRPLNRLPERRRGDYVLYWMSRARRTRFNEALQRAAARAASLDRPLLVLETLELSEPWASDRRHRFALDGMGDNARALQRRSVRYLGHLERRPNEAAALVLALARRASAVVVDDYPARLRPPTLEEVAPGLEVPVEAVDANGLVPLRACPRAFPAARSFRLFLQRELPRLLAPGLEDPLAGLGRARGAEVPGPVLRRFGLLEALPGEGAGALSGLPIDHGVPPAPTPGGSRAGRERLARFLETGLARYARERSDLDHPAASGLSPYLHAGHLGAAEVFAAVAGEEGFRPSRLLPARRGGARGLFGMGEGAEAFLDELVVWRELGLNFCALRDDFDRYESLPAWARATLEAHARDPRPALYPLEELEGARTLDPLWNAAQRQLVREGVIPNYLRMVWGKRVLEWTPHPREALRALVQLNNRWALDGADPSSFSGIFWVLGRYDRPWGPERPIFGKVRYMSSAATARKLRVKGYLARFGA